MQKKTLGSDAMLLLTSAIWGFAFVAQMKGMDYLGPYLYNGVRFALGSASLIPLIFILKGQQKKKSPVTSNTMKISPTLGQTFIAGALAGTILFIGASLQQVGLQFTTVGKTGFITGLYVVLVPILGILLKHRTGKATWVGALLAAVGLYFISVTGDFNIGKGDLLVLFSSFFFACHVLIIDRFSKQYDVLILSSLQYAGCAILSMIVALITEPIEFDSIVQATLPIIYGGLGSVGIAYTLQVVAQKNAPPSHSAIIMSLESVFAVIGGVIFLAEGMTLRGYFGCTLMLTGMIASQWDVIFSSKRTKKTVS